MASIINKRQQARNERTLQELIKNVPGNDRCADCYARNPGWASWSLGVFLCMRCAALHRKLGTHLSKVKSLSMDSWSADQVETMKRVGNVASNRIYNPRNIKPVIPVDEDEVDPAVERYIRDKYQHKTLGVEKAQPAFSHRTGSSTSTEDIPPPPPPKPTNHFGASVRANSSQYPVGRTDNPLPPLPSRSQDSQRVSKLPESDVAGKRRSFDLKLERLHEMGFMNDNRNVAVLKGLNGNFDKSVQTLVRLGEGPLHRHVDPQSNLQTEVQRATSPPQAAPATATQNRSVSPAAGISVTTQPTISPTNPYNPFLAPQQTYSPQPPLEQSFNNMHLSQQPLFPHNTGNWQQQPYQQNNPFLKSFTPPLSPTSYQQPTPFGNASASSYYESAVSQAETAARSNPFLRTSRSQNFAMSSNPFYQTPQSTGSTSVDQQAFNVPPVPSIPNWASNGKSASLPQVMSQQPQQQHHFQPQHFVTQQPQIFSSPEHSPSPWDQPQNIFNSSFPQPTYNQNQPLPQQGYPQQQPQQAARYDKNSLLALYNYPHLAPAKPAVSSPLASEASSPATPSTQQPAATTHMQQKRVSSMPLMASQPNAGSAKSGSLNPFANKVNAGAQGQGGPAGHVPQESVDFVGLMNGRHSPDAFAGLSARAV